MEDRELTRRVAQGDESALAILVERYHRPLFRFLWHASGSRDDAEDLTCQALLRAVADIRGFRGDGPLRAWIFRIGHRELLRFRRRRIVFDLLSPGAPTVGAPPSEDLVVLSAALQRLPPPQREAFLLIEVEGFTVAEAANSLRTPAGTVKSRCHHARLRLRELLAPAYPEVSNYASTLTD